MPHPGQSEGARLVPDRGDVGIARFTIAGAIALAKLQNQASLLGYHARSRKVEQPALALALRRLAREILGHQAELDALVRAKRYPGPPADRAAAWRVSIAASVTMSSENIPAFLTFCRFAHGPGIVV